MLLVHIQRIEGLFVLPRNTSQRADLGKTMRRPAAYFFILFSLGGIYFALPAGAQEGPIEIDKCEKIDHPGSYKLVKNLKASGDCLVISVDFVTINLAGFTITGPNSIMQTSTGIMTAPPGNSRLGGLAVRNGSISGFSNGVDLAFADGSIVEGLRVSGVLGVTGVGIEGNGIVRGNTVRNFGSGPHLGIGIDFTGTVTGNYTTDNGGVGIAANQGSTVIANTSTGNGRFSVFCPSNLTGNTALNNPLGNFQLMGDGCNNTNNVAP
jgi:hypothetical protein